MRASGPGGQKVNKTDSACRVTHIPTGMNVKNFEERDQDSNKARALEILTNRLFEMVNTERMSEYASSRKEQMASGDIADKIRTYNWPNDRITDHRINS